jgi:peptide chain release factor subunit 1
VTAITEDAIRRLAGFKSESAPVTSCYLDIDGRRYVRHQDYEQELHHLLRRARARANGTTSVSDDLDRMERFVRNGIDRSGMRGLAMFACSAEDFFETIPLPVPVRSQVVVNPVPAVGQLERLVREYESFAVLLADREQARILVFELGELVERSEVFEALPRGYDSRGERDMGDPTHHVEELATQHLRHTAAAIWEVFSERPFEHLTIGASDAIASALEAELHPYLSERVRHPIDVAVDASLDEVRAAAREVEWRVEREREAVLVGQVREAVARDQRGAAGLESVLDALGGRRIERLLVSHGFSKQGWRCGTCDRLAVVGRNCAVCGEAMEPIEDVVEEAVDEALEQSCSVDICVDNADLDVLGRIAALLRY